MQQEDDGEKPAAQVIPEPTQVASNRSAAPTAREPGNKVGKQVGAGHGHGEDRPDPGAAGQHEPTGCGKCDQSNWDQASAKIIEDLPAIECGQSGRETSVAGAGRPASEPRQELPVTTYPPVPAAGVLDIAGREVLIEDDVARQRSASVYSFEEIVADQGVLGHSPLEALVEGGDFVDPLADIDSFAEEILIDVGNGAAVDVDCRISGVEPSEERAGSAFWGDLDPRLHDRVASADSTRCLIEVALLRGCASVPTRRLTDPGGSVVSASAVTTNRMPRSASILPSVTEKPEVSSPSTKRLNCSSLPRFLSHAIQQSSAGLKRRGRCSRWKGPSLPCP